MNKVVILIHGYNVSNPERSVGLLRPCFEKLGYEVVMLNYGYWPFTWQITRQNPKVAKRLAVLVEEWNAKGYAVDLCGHSNGDTIIRLASRDYQIDVRTVVGINPALKKDTHPCPTAKLVQVWYNGGDMPVVLGKWLRWLTPWARKARPWGQMGMEGYRGDVTDSPVVSFDAGNSFKVKASGHSAVFKKPERGFFLSRIALYCHDQSMRVGPGDA